LLAPDLFVTSDTVHHAESILAVRQFLDIVVAVGAGQRAVHALLKGFGSDEQRFLPGLPVLPGRDTEALDAVALLALGVLEMWWTVWWSQHTKMRCGL